MIYPSSPDYFATFACQAVEAGVRVVGGCCGTTAGHVLVWYFATLSQIRTVYGSLTTAIVVLLSLEIAALVLLMGAQVIAEYERIEWEPVTLPPRPMHTAG